MTRDGLSSFFLSRASSFIFHASGFLLFYRRVINVVRDYVTSLCSPILFLPLFLSSSLSTCNYILKNKVTLSSGSIPA